MKRLTHINNRKARKENPKPVSFFAVNACPPQVGGAGSAAQVPCVAKVPRLAACLDASLFADPYLRLRR